MTRLILQQRTPILDPFADPLCPICKEELQTIEYWLRTCPRLDETKQQPQAVQKTFLCAQTSTSAQDRDGNSPNRKKSQTSLPQSPFNPLQANLITPSCNGRTRLLTHTLHPFVVRLTQPVLMYRPSHPLPSNVTGSCLRKVPSTICGYPSEIKSPSLHRRQPRR